MEIARAAACELVAEVLRGGHSVTIRANGASMMPAIWPGDRLTIRPLDARWLAIGEVALTQHSRGLRAHRVVAQSVADGPIGIVTRGDALDHPDCVVAAENVLGIVVCRNGVPLATTTSWRRRIFALVMVSSDAVQSLVLKLRSLRNTLVSKPTSRNSCVGPATI